jgi:hypothetical protein
MVLPNRNQKRCLCSTVTQSTDSFPKANERTAQLQNRVPRRDWSTVAAQLEFLEDVAERLAITKLDQWYSVKQKTFADVGGM